MKFFFKVLIFFIAFSSQAKEVCDLALKKANEERVIIPSYQSGHKVSGDGRLYFYSAPDEQCKINDLFIINGDLVNASVDYNEFTYVIYFSKGGKEFDGWVKSNRLVPTGTGIGPAK